MPFRLDTKHVPEGYDEELLDKLSEDGFVDEDELPDSDRFDCHILITGLPAIDESKVKKLQEALIGKIPERFKVTADLVDIPLEPADANGSRQSAQLAVLGPLSSPEAAAQLVKVLDGYNFTKKLKLRATILDNFDSFFSKEEYDIRKSAKEIKAVDRTDMDKWLEDGREQLLLRYADKTEVKWCHPAGGIEMCDNDDTKQKGKWCQRQVAWSPQGSYVVTMHKQGVALWCRQFLEEQRIRLEHPEVAGVLFSPTETHVLTYDYSGGPSSYRLFAVRTGECIWTSRTPPLTPDYTKDGDDPALIEERYPHFLWSHDGAYLAARATGAAEGSSKVLLFEVTEDEVFPTMDPDTKTRGHLDIPADKISWSPTMNWLAVWSKERGNTPAKVVLYSIPSREQLATRARTQCTASLHWHPNGSFLCMNMTKLTKSQQQQGSYFEIFRLNEKNMPVENVSIKEPVKAFEWEPNAERAAVLVELEQNACIRFFSMKNGVELLAQLELPGKDFNTVRWSPEGEFWVAAALRGSGDLFFGQLTEDKKKGARIEVLYKDEHYSMSTLEFDPSGRLLLTAVVPGLSEQGDMTLQNEAGYALRTFQGRNLTGTIRKEKFYFIGFRPHPRTSRKPELRDEIKNNLRDLSRKYEEADAVVRKKNRAQESRRRQELQSKFEAVLNGIKQKYAHLETDYQGRMASVGIQENTWDWVEDKVEVQVGEVKESVVAQGPR